MTTLSVNCETDESHERALNASPFVQLFTNFIPIAAILNHGRMGKTE